MVEREICDKCGRIIGETETAYKQSKQTLCADCYDAANKSGVSGKIITGPACPLCNEPMIKTSLNLGRFVMGVIFAIIGGIFIISSFGSGVGFCAFFPLGILLFLSGAHESKYYKKVWKCPACGNFSERVEIKPRHK